MVRPYPNRLIPKRDAWFRSHRPQPGGPAMAAKKPGAQATVTLKHLAASLAETHEMSKKQTEAVLGDLVGLVSKHLKKGDRIRIGGLGILVVRKRAARLRRNSATGAPIGVQASKKVAFRAAKELKEAVCPAAPAFATGHWRAPSGAGAVIPRPE